MCLFGLRHRCEPTFTTVFCVVGWSDASWACRREGSSKGGHLVGITNTSFLEQAERKVSVFRWQSGRLAQVARSSKAAELQAAVDAEGELTYIRLSLWEGGVYPSRYLLRVRRTSTGDGCRFFLSHDASDSTHCKNKKTWRNGRKLHVWRAPNRLLVVQTGESATQAKVFQASAVPQGICENLTQLAGEPTRGWRWPCTEYCNRPLSKEQERCYGGLEKHYESGQSLCP